MNEPSLNSSHHHVEETVNDRGVARGRRIGRLGARGSSLSRRILRPAILRARVRPPLLPAVLPTLLPAVLLSARSAILRAAVSALLRRPGSDAQVRLVT